MKIIDFEQVRSLQIPPHTFFEWASDVIAKKKEMLLPAKISMSTPVEGSFMNCMPSIIESENCCGVKMVSRYPERVPSLDSQILLYRLSDGCPLALMDGNYITAMRTGAVAAHSIHLFAKDNFSVMGFIGLGNTARAALKVLLSVYPDRQFTIKLFKYKDQHLQFAAAFPEIEFTFCDTVEEVVAGSEVVVSAVTRFDADVCDESLFEKGCLLVPIHTRGFTNCDLTFDKIFADDTAHVHGFRNFDKFRSFAEVNAVVTGECAGRTSQEERILAYNIGLSIHDIYCANKIYHMCADGMKVDLKSPQEKFWVGN